MAKPKCKYCEEIIQNKDDKLVIIEKTKTGKPKRINIHKNCEEDYKELIKYKENELYWFNQVYEQIKELLGYTKEQKLPKFLIVRLQDLRNGTIVKKGEGRVVKSKEGYKYEIMFDCLLSSGEAIRWAIKNKNFINEKTKINYLMAIVESNINDNYLLYLSRERNKSNEITNDIITEEVRMEEIINNTAKNVVKKNNSGISKFLDEDDF